ncbi:MAG: methionine adenosyltransferase domain-containing protein, partial [Spirochaetia bacterium]|nr:methionine adenosyltransferase domain-containing protein [Spirochaetia bacterium]
RYIAKNIVASGVFERCELQLAYAIGYPQPVSVMIDTFGTAAVEESKLTALVQDMFDLSPAGIIKTLDLRRPIYKQTTFYGHFGKPGLPWEKTDKAAEIAKALS